MAKKTEKNIPLNPDGSNAKGKKKKAKKKSKGHPKLYVAFLTLFCIFVAGMLTVIIIGNSVASYMDSHVNGELAINLEDYKDSQNQTSIMYGYNDAGKAIELARLHGTENRIWVDFDEMPENLIQAYVCLEDRKFFTHPGVDWIRTIAVMIKPEFAGQGASTITQQLIKNLTDDDQTTYNRKFNEIIRALNLEKNYSKKDIIEAYLNTVSLGAGCYGVKTAAETYFGKEVSELNLLECCALAGITKAPYTNNPYVNKDGNFQKRIDRCLYAMWEEGKISEKTYNKYLGKSPKVKPRGSVSTDSEEKTDILSWYEEYVIDQVIADLQKEYEYDYQEASRMIYYGGLRIYAAVDIDMQKTLEDMYRNRTGFPSSRYDSRGQLPQSSMTIMDYQGRIVALVGGTGKKTANNVYNRAVDHRAKRQPGSSIKPLSVYAPAVDLGIVSANSPIIEKALEGYNNGKDWPQNFNGDHGSGE